MLDNLIKCIIIKMEEDGLSPATKEKYCRDIRYFYEYLGQEQTITRSLVLAYRTSLLEQYKLSSANSMIASLNYLLRYLSLEECCVPYYKIQHNAFRDVDRELNKEEYHILLDGAIANNYRRLYMIMLTLGMTGIRISELQYITVEALDKQKAVINMKGKIRVILLPGSLIQELRQYAKDKDIRSGSIFLTASGRHIDRSNILHDMKKLCRKCGINPSKVYPHSFRHLFAVTYYEKEKDICHLADILGHSDINTTRLYTLQSAEIQKQKIDELDLFHVYKRPST